MFQPLEDQIACAEAHYQKLLEEARIERLLNAGKCRQATPRLTARGLLLTLSDLLIKLGQEIRAVCGVSPLSVSEDEASNFRVQ